MRSSFNILSGFSRKKRSRRWMTHRLSTLASSPSTPTTACGVFASNTCVIWLVGLKKKHRLDTHIVVVTVRAILVAFLVSGHVLPKCLFTFLAHESHLQCFCKLMRLRLCMALGTVEPLFAARSTDGDLGVQDMFTTCPVIGILINQIRRDRIIGSCRTRKT